MWKIIVLWYRTLTTTRKEELKPKPPNQLQIKRKTDCVTLLYVTFNYILLCGEQSNENCIIRLHYFLIGKPAQRPWFIWHFVSFSSSYSENLWPNYSFVLKCWIFGNVNVCNFMSIVKKGTSWCYYMDSINFIFGGEKIS